MRIAIDVSQIVYDTGVSSYTKNLVKSILTVDRENEYLLYAGSLRRAGDITAVFPQAKVFPIPPTLADFIWNRLHIFPIEKLIGEIDVFHSSDWSEPPTKAFKVTTVHDLYPLKFPKLVHAKIREVHKRKLSWSIHECKRIIVPSISTQNDLIEIGVSKDIIRVIPEAPSITKANESSVAEVKKKYNLQGDYILAVGVTPLKNTKRLIDAFHLSKAGKNLKLAIIGRPVNIEIDEQRDVRILGHVSQADYAALMTGASGLLFASLYEGFGLPILDAFTCQTPVVTSNVSSMPEVAGEAAILVDPYDVNSIAEGIQKALKGPKGLIEKGSERVKKYSWEIAAKSTIEVYKEAKK